MCFSGQYTCLDGVLLVCLTSEMPMMDNYDFCKQLDIWEEDLRSELEANMCVAVAQIDSKETLLAEVYIESLNEKIKICLN